ncbi:MAG TPA: hypothetical protein VFE19_11990 [Jatrophihabitantaceae bacterium]|jgi:hypothetical protein|nr:hypothetical protein [Jatrophihabitantaceae bacterium]
MTMSVDELLRDDAQRWAASFPEVAPPDLTVTPVRAPRRLRWLAVAAAIALVASAAGLFIARSASDTGEARPGSAAPTPTTSVTSHSNSVPTSKLTSLARNAVSYYSGTRASAFSAAAVKTTYGPAQSILGGDKSYDVPAQTSVWIVELRGSFTCANCEGISAGPALQGTVVDVIVNADTFDGYDSALSSTEHDLSQLGEVIQLKP